MECCTVIKKNPAFIEYSTWAGENDYDIIVRGKGRFKPYL